MPLKQEILIKPPFEGHIDTHFLIEGLEFFYIFDFLAHSCKNVV